MTNTPITAPIKRWLDADIDDTALRGKTIAIIGYGNQGRPQALNLRDSGHTVIVGAREGKKAWQAATDDGFDVMRGKKAVPQADVVMLLLPDHMIHIVAGCLPLTERHAIGIGHGFCLHAGWWAPEAQHNIFLLAPKSHGSGVRQEYLDKTGVPAFVATVQAGTMAEADLHNIALAYGKGIGCGMRGIYQSSLQEETVCDLFSEQAVLCGGLNHLILAAFETLTERGYSAEAATIRCLYELKTMGKLIQERGITGLRHAISSAALVGDITRGPRIVDDTVKATLKQLLTEIEDGTFARDFEQNESQAQLAALRNQHANHPIEAAYERIMNATTVSSPSL